MKQLFWCLTVAMSFGATALAQEEPEIKYHLELRARYYNILKGVSGDEPASGYDGTQSYVAQRSLLGLNFRKGERLGGRLTLLHSANWGRTTTYDGDANNSNYSPNTGDSATGTQDGVGNYENMILVNEAWGWWKMTDSITLNIGRGGMTIADGSVISRNDWEPIPTSLEGGQLSWDMDKLVMNVFGAKLEELPRRSRSGIDANDPETNLYGISVDGKMLPESLSMLNGHLLQMNSSQNTRAKLPAASGAPTNDVITALGKNIQRLGFTVKGGWRSFDFRTSGALEEGKMYQKPAEEINVQSHMVDVELGYTLPRFIKMRFMANFHLDSGDRDVTERRATESSVGSDNKWNRYNPLFYDAHEYAGLMDIVGWGNLTYYKLGVSASPFENATTAVNYLFLYRSSEKDVVTAGSMGRELWAGFQPDATRVDDRNIGQELDVTADYSFDGGFTAGVLVGLFFPGSYIKDGTNTITGTGNTEKLGENIRQVLAQARYSF